MRMANQLDFMRLSNNRQTVAQQNNIAMYVVRGFFLG